MTVIHTQRLLLRPARIEDVAALFPVMCDPETMRYWSTPPHSEMAQTGEFVSAMMEIPAGEGEDFIIELAGRAVGKAGLYRFPDIGYVLARELWGQGFAREALAAVVARAFTVHSLPRITADVDPRNAASLGLLARLGFVRTGYRKHSWLVGDEWCDSVDLALDAQTWSTAGALP